MKEGSIRAVALVALRHGHSVLLAEIRDRITGEVFWRAPGGEIEFGEAAIDAAAREIKEEFGIHVGGLRQLGVIENRFEHEGKPGHEIVFVFEGTWPHSRPPEACKSGVESDGSRFACQWVPIDGLAELNVVPPRFVELLRDNAR